MNESQFEKEYRLVVAFSELRKAYKELVTASKALPDADVSEGYPFFLLDFEAIAPAVDQWCAIQMAKLLEGLPNRVVNPACLSCPFVGIGLDATGQCAGASSTQCHVFPYILYSLQQATAALFSLGYAVNGMSDSAIEIAYLKEVDKHVQKAKEARAAGDQQAASGSR